jgi:hypothetical protein
MLHRIAFVLVASLVGVTVAPSASAQIGGGTGTPPPTSVVIAPDDKTIENTPPSAANQLNCWVSRSNNAAIAVSVYMSGGGSQLVGKLRRYSKGDEEYEDTTTQIKLPDGTTTPALKVIMFNLEHEANPKYPDLYKMMYAPSVGSPIKVGYLNFVRGNKTRMSSKVSIRLDHTTVVGVNNPCDEPPIDDIGEEEEIRRSTSTTLGENAPGASLSFIVVGP